MYCSVSKKSPSTKQENTILIQNETSSVLGLNNLGNFGSGSFIKGSIYSEGMEEYFESPCCKRYFKEAVEPSQSGSPA
jgi:hypothetical protein